MGRKKYLVLIGVVGLMMVLSLPLMFLAIPLLLKGPQPCADPSVQNDSVAVSLNGSQLTVKGARMKTDQRKVAQIAANAVVRRPGDFKSKDEQKRAMMALFAGGIVESGLRNLDYGDRDSLGFLQQRPSQGWGTPSQVQDVSFAANTFLDRFKALPGWRTVPFSGLGQLVQDVQRSAYPDEYQKRMGEAERIYQRLTGFEPVSIAAGVDSVSAECDEASDPTDKVVSDALQAAQSMLGREYPGSQLVVKAYADANVKLPAGNIDRLMKYRGDNQAGVSAKFIDGSNISVGALKPGDMLVYSDSTSTDPSDASYAGLFKSSPSNGLKMATYNVLGSVNTPKTGPRSGPNRVATAARLIESNNFAVVGLQELAPDQRERLINTLPDRYDIYPKTSNYRATARPPAVSSARSVVYDTSVVRFIKATNLVGPYETNRDRTDFAQITFEHLASGQEFYFINEHAPAHARNTDLRTANANARAGQIDRLSGNGLPIFLVGDMNSGKRASMHGTITRSGKIIDAFDKWARSGNPARTSLSPIDRIYASPNMEVVDVNSIPRSRTASDHPVPYATYGGPFATSSGKQGELGTMIAPRSSSGIVDELPVTKRGLIGVLRLTITDSGGNGTVASNGKWAIPVPKGYRLTATFGQSGSLWSANHTGLDFAAPNGTPIVAVTSGTVKEAGWAGAYGNRTVIKLSDGTELWYCHQSRIRVRVGETVTTGQVIGEVGATGNVTGPHLHLEVRTPNGTPIDPMQVLRSKGLNP